MTFDLIGGANVNVNGTQGAYNLDVDTHILSFTGTIPLSCGVESNIAAQCPAGNYKVIYLTENAMQILFDGDSETPFTMNYVSKEYKDNYVPPVVTTITLPDTLRLYDTKNNWAVTKTYLGGSITTLASDLTYDPVSGNIYGVFFNADYSDCKSFGTISLDNPMQGVYSSNIIADLPERMVAIAANQKGVIYTIGKSGKLYTVDKQTGAATEVGSTGVSDVVPGFYQSACCDMKTGKIFWAACYGQYGDFGIYEVDPATGAATLVGDTGYDGTYTEDQVTGLTTLEDVARPVFVNGVDNLAAVFDKNSLTGQITFTLPTQNSQGEALTGDVSYALSIDGAAAGQGTGAAGASVSMDVTTTAGLHTFTVVAT